MTAAGLDAVMAAVRQRLGAGPGPAGAALEDRPGCFSFARARELALDPARWRPGELAHQEACARCHSLVAAFEREMPHLPLWSLLRGRLGALAGEQGAAFVYHVEEGGCAACRARLARLESLLPRL